MRRLTEDMPGSGGTLRADPEDFRVDEEIPYAPSGSGDHLFLRVEKRGMDTFEAVRRLVRGLGLDPGRARGVGAAGLKDRHAVARQWLSLPWPGGARLPAPGPLAEGLELLEVARHAHKLRRGHVARNRFSVVLREVPPGGLDRAATTLEALRARGLPNRFGPQRFGRAGDNPERARAILAGRERPPRDRRLAGLLLSSLQSELFDRVLELRLEDGRWDEPRLGDRMQKHRFDDAGEPLTGGPEFWVDDPEAERPRMRALAISPMARLPGRRLAAARGEAATLEARAVRDVGLEAETLQRLGAGVFRSLRVPLGPSARVDAVADDPEAFRVTVVLPAGSYATVLLDELAKPAQPLTRRLPEPGGSR